MCVQVTSLQYRRLDVTWEIVTPKGMMIKTVKNDEPKYGKEYDVELMKEVVMKCMRKEV